MWWLWLLLGGFIGFLLGFFVFSLLWLGRLDDEDMIQ